MAPTEAEVLTNHLIRPAPLNAIVTYEWFTSLFPRARRNSEQVRQLWRDLEAQRERTIDQVRENIEHEVRRGLAMRREILAARREAAREEEDIEIETERALFGEVSGATSANHTLDSIIPELEGAAGLLQAEIAKLKEEEEELRGAIAQTVGGLSDLRYGKLGGSQLKEEVVDGLTTLEETCGRKMR